MYNTLLTGVEIKVLAIVFDSYMHGRNYKTNGHMQ